MYPNTFSLLDLITVSFLILSCSGHKEPIVGLLDQVKRDREAAVTNMNTS